MAPASTLRSVLALSAFALVTSAVSTASAYSVKKTTHGEFVHWETNNVTFAIDSSVDANVANGSDATKQAMKSWSGTVGAPDIAAVKADATSPTAPSFDRKNGVFYMPGGYEPAGRALAITVLTYDNATGRILDADVVFNGSYAFKVLQENEGQRLYSARTDDVGHAEDVDPGEDDTVYDLHHVVAHELGHSLGMNDEMGKKDALMYRYSAPNDATLRQPASDDIAGLAELYSKDLDAHGNGCGSATVAPKKPSATASNLAMIATLGLLVFLVLRARGPGYSRGRIWTDRRARGAFLLATAAAAIALVPDLSGGKGVARASEPLSALNDLGHARARVVATSTRIENGLFKTSYELATTTCRASSCPKSGRGLVYGGTVGNITQEVGGYYAPSGGDDVDVSFKSLPSELAALKPLAGRHTNEQLADVRVVTRAR